jgi:hypothetical protein
MKSLRTLAVMAVLALVAAVDFVRDTAFATYAAVKRAAVFVFDLGLSLVAAEPQPASTPQFHQMREYRQRQERREQPVITAAWRMCPSC